jgi:hypothetical protein
MAEQQTQQMLRVGILPAMIGQEGDTPIVVEIPRNTPPDKIRELALAQAQASTPNTVKLGAGTGANQFGVSMGDKFAGVTLPVGDGQAERDFLESIPQLAGLAAQFTPMGKAGYLAAGGVPAFIEMARQLLSGEEIDPVQGAMQGAGGMMAHGVGNVIKGFGDTGEGLVRRSLNIREPFKTRAAEEVLPRAAIREKAKMTIPGVDKVRDRAAATGLGSLDDLAEVMERTRLDSSLGPVGGGGGIMAALRDLISNPRQMAVGSAMASPFGVDTAKTIAPTAEAGLRTLMAWISSLTDNPEAEAAASRPGAPARRRLPDR